ncbi:hypothetical protein BMS3Bbin15_01305 [archaeon BMS3Bbin15]|nr:hypothetical protein BMS3Bbin15_01305 [archaeon BMS3Bbin15]
MRYLRRDEMHKIKRYPGTPSKECTAAVHNGHRLHTKKANLCRPVVVCTTLGHYYMTLK